ncbi:Peptidoglycan-binding protein ArfA [compost metagenome]
MKRKPEVTVTIEGYTDSSGDMRHNMKLSQQRANTVKKALVAYGVQARRITAVGKGSLNPIADNDTPEGRAKNRRIEAVIHQ